MNISVILCTYNRCRSLARTLDSLAVQQLPDSVDWEVIVVDNNSKDQTREVVEEFCGPHSGRFRYLFEPQQGLSHARNAGIREARGDVLAFTDDDVTLDPKWLLNLTSALRDGTAVGTGGRILPEQTFVPPRWLSVNQKHALAPLAIFDGGASPYQLADPPFGANMAFQKKMFEKYGVFRTDLGRCGESLISNEDTEYGRRLLTAGEPLRYEASAIIYHPVTENRMEKKYFLAWWLGKGRANIRQLAAPLNTKWQVAGVPFALFFKLADYTLRWMLTFESAKRFNCRVAVWEKIGEILESYNLSRNRNGIHSRKRFIAGDGISVQSDESRP
jgi:glycosyltransferase involved in cell wall biosynthesis